MGWQRDAPCPGLDCTRHPTPCPALPALQIWVPAARSQRVPWELAERLSGSLSKLPVPVTQDVPGCAKLLLHLTILIFI